MDLGPVKTIPVGVWPNSKTPYPAFSIELEEGGSNIELAPFSYLSHNACDCA
ncbi:hypothetical protein Mgrana_01897 [Meiothermus granaticius NBRC 107808]|uniref:Uncharacterized protein n=1 Tax=Meiothermus granaticius NBRC 107808 TaxID=1227551 RepID=A0A399F7L8_9DEIN|nr:hypothetical protein Mgrana_01897 [Meiothermus granaticius NBRC 107808]